MDIVYRMESATAAEIRTQMDDPPTYTTVRGLLRILVEKGRLQIERDGARYVYRPTVAPGAAGKAMIAHVARTFFGGSPSRALSALLGILFPEQMGPFEKLMGEKMNPEGGQ